MVSCLLYFSYDFLKMFTECPSNCNKCQWSGSAAVCTVHACMNGYAPDSNGNCAGKIKLNHFLDAPIDELKPNH